ncbi:MAG: toll/interleukin-1 receptor domain-containing protein [Candidatus Brocadia sp.]|nr:toll/interleukin-1 receptor domain-containing protein [Candidatus Brocadia sp.]
MGSNQHILQIRIHEIETRWKSLTQKLNLVSKQKDAETRAEEKLRMDSLIEDIETERRKLESELRQLEDEIKKLSDLSAGDHSKQVGRPIELFYSYAHKDEALRDRLEVSLKLLKHQGIIKDWHDRGISAGSEWEKQIDEHLETADLILLLVSPDFIASDYIWENELKRAMERHQTGEARVIPIILRETDWTTAPFATLQALPKDAKPVTSWPDTDAAFADIARGIRKVAEELLTNLG